MKFHKALFLLAAGFLVPGLQSHADTHGRIVSASLNEVSQSSCLPRIKAETEAEMQALKTAQLYCRKEGFGWHASSVKDLGNLDCQRCDGSHYSCGYSTISLECRKAESKLSWSGWFSRNP